jgi:hypothetical protein
MADPQYHAAQFATSATSAGSALSWSLYQVSQHGPGWSLVPPILLSAASLYGAYWSGRKMRDDLAAIQKLRDQEQARADEIHRARLDRVRAGLEQIDVRP